MENEFVHVAVGVILNSANEVLVSLRHPDSHQGGLWEFPGGKLEEGEDVQTALRRELLEELDILVEPERELLTVNFEYPEKRVLLDVWVVREFSGDVVGKEGQAIRWLSVADLHPENFPPANAPIIQALQQLVS